MAFFENTKLKKCMGVVFLQSEFRVSKTFFIENSSQIEEFMRFRFFAKFCPQF